MTSEDICKILEASKETSVSKIKCGNLLIEFNNLTNSGFTINNTNTVPFVNDVEVAADPKDNGETTDTKEIVDEFSLAQLMATDPEEFEKRLMRG